MSEKRYFKIEYDEEWYLFDSTTISEQLVKEQAEYGYGVFANSLSPSEVVDLLNEQQATIQRMKHSLNPIYRAFEKHYDYDMRNAVWLIDELSYDEIVDELYIAETDSKNRKEASMYWKKKVDEQQATINNQDEEIKKLKKTERSWRKIHCCNKESNNCEIVIEQQNTINELMEENENLKLKIVSLENEVQRQKNEIKNTRKEFIKKKEELNWLKSEDYLKKIY